MKRPVMIPIDFLIEVEYVEVVGFRFAAAEVVAMHRTAQEV